ncbi:MAG: type II secretion system minor pseudopilin GspK [Pseudomonadota bacterium]
MFDNSAAPSLCKAGAGPAPGAKLDAGAARQRGAAVLMALFVATLATLIVTGLFWNQFVLLRTIENQQLVSQSRLLLRGALDWARAILREDAARSNYDARTEPWATPLAPTRLDQLGETSALASQATIEGDIDDAQARLNLRNLVSGDGQIVERELAALRRLCALLAVPEATADLIAQRMAEAFAPAPAPAGDGRAKPRPIPLVLPRDLFAVDGIDPEAAAKLATHVVVLDEPTPVNVNTAASEVIAARIAGLTWMDANRIVEQRTQLGYFRDVADLRNRLGDKATGLMPQDVSTTSRYFFVRGRVRLDRASTGMEALVKRGAPGAPAPISVLWQREL